MKKIVMILAAMAAVLSSCSKSELESVSANGSKDIVLNISVSDPGAGTKALIKEGWVNGDEISIWYDTNIGTNPDLVITYDADNEKWIQKEGATVSDNTPSTSGGYAKALYNGDVKVASKDEYTYENNTLTFSIENWKFLTEVQVVIKGLTSTSAGSYTLACDKFTPLASTGNGYTVNSDGITASTGTKGVAVTGISNTDGVAFVFATADYSSTAADYKFTLTDNTSTPAVTKVYTATTDKINGTSGEMTAIKALTIASDRFAKAAPEGFVDLGVVVNSKPLYWAEKNLGASNSWDYGKYFQWGDIAGHVCNGTATGSTFEGDYNFQWSNTPFHTGTTSTKDWTKYIPTDKSRYWSGDGSPDNKIVLDVDDDAAYKASSGAWRMPAKEDFTELAKQCFLEWTEGYGSTGVKGIIVWKAKTGDAGWFKPIMTGKGRKIKDDGTGYETTEDHTFGNSYVIGTDTHVFFPADGYGSGTKLTSPGSYGYCWSCSLYSSNPTYAYSLNFTANNVNPQGNSTRYCGLSVRPVSD